MKKLFSTSFLLITVLFLYNCSKDNINEPNIDFSSLSKSQIQKIIDDNNEQLLQAREVDFDTVPNDGEGGTCPMRAVSDETKDPNDKSLMNSLTSKLYDIRDNILKGKSTGEYYIQAYYYLGSKLKNEPVTVTDIQKCLKIIPTFFDVYDKLTDSSYTGVVISPSQRDELIDYVQYYKSKKINDNTYQDLLNTVISDLNTITNRNSSQIMDFLKL